MVCGCGDSHPCRVATRRERDNDSSSSMRQGDRRHEDTEIIWSAVDCWLPLWTFWHSEGASQLNNKGYEYALAPIKLLERERERQRERHRK